MFSLIAEKVLQDGGVVFGVAFNEKLELKHTYVENVKGLQIFRGSKYFQSTIGDTYAKVKEFLNSGRKVMFTGTPCQIEGLKAYLGKEKDNLFTQDIICHGVPSSKVHEKYLEYLKSKCKTEKIENIAPEMDDDKGTSLVIINSEKGKKIFEQIKDKINYKQVDFEEAIRYNPSMTTSVKPDPNRKKFFENLDKMPFDELVKKYTYTPSIFKRILWKVKRVVKKIIKK